MNKYVNIKNNFEQKKGYHINIVSGCS